MSPGQTPGETLLKQAPAIQETLLRSPLMEQSLLRGGAQPGKTPPPLQETLLRSPAPVEETLFKVAPDTAEMAGQEDKPRILEGLYRLDAEIGRGAMGTVYRVHHLSWGIDLAVKTIRLDCFSPTLLELFRSEAEVWMDLAKHPHIATAFYIRDLEGMPAIFMEYAGGGTLADWLRLNPRATLAERLEKAIQFCEGMAYAHSRQLIHRDIKPANVLLLEDGTVKITDFGLARNLTPAEGRGPGGETELETCGTPPYMPPEQWAAAASAREPADIYAFGVLLYEMLTGRRPFEMEEDDPRPPELAFRLMHLSEPPPPPERFSPNLPPELGSLILSCLEKDPSSRPGGFPRIQEKLLGFYRAISGSDYVPIPFDLDKQRLDDLNNRALSFLDLGREDKAETLWKQALSSDTRHYASNINLALLYWRRDFLGQASTIQHLLENATETEPARGFYTQGLMALLSGHAEQALDIADLALTRTGNDADLLNLKGLALMLARFLRTYQPIHHAVRTQVRHYNSNHRHEMAPASFRAALKEQPDHPGLLGNLVLALRNAGLHEEAQSTLDRARRQGLRPAPQRFLAPQWLKSMSLTTWGENPLFIHEPSNRFYLQQGTRANSFELGEYELSSGKLLRTLSGGIPWGIIPNLIPNIKGGGLAFLGGTQALELRSPGNGALLGRFKTAQPGTPTAPNRPHRGAYVVAGTALTAVGVSPDNRILISSRANGTLEITDLQPGTTPTVVEGITASRANVIAFADELQALLGGQDGVLRRISFPDSAHRDGHRMVTSDSKHEKAIRALCICPDLELAITGSEDHTLRLWDLSSLDCLQVLRGHRAAIRALAMTPDRAALVSLADDGTLKIWQPQGGSTRLRPRSEQPLSPFVLARDFQVFQEGLSISLAGLSPDGRYAIVGSSKRGQLNRAGYTDQVALWEVDPPQPQEIPWYFRALEPVFCRVATVTEEVVSERTLSRLLREARELLVQNRYKECHQKVQEALALPDSGQNPELQELMDRLLDRGARKGLSQMVRIGTCAQAWQDRLDLSPRGTHLFTLDTTARQIRMIHLEGETEREKRLQHPHPPTAYAVGQEPFLLSGDREGNLHLWDTGENRILRTINLGHARIPAQILLSPDEQQALISVSTHGLLLLDLPTGQVLWEETIEKGTFSQPGFSPDGRFFLYARTMNLQGTADQTRELLVRDTRTTAAVLTVPNASSNYQLASDYQLWVLTFRGETLEHWDLLRMERMAVIRPRLQGGSLLALCPQRRLAVLALGNSIRLLDLDRHQETALLQVRHPSSALLVSPDQRFVLAVSAQGQISVLNLLEERIEKELSAGFPVVLSPTWQTLWAGQKGASVHVFSLYWEIYFPESSPDPLPPREQPPDQEPADTGPLATWLKPEPKEQFRLLRAQALAAEACGNDTQAVSLLEEGLKTLQEASCPETRDDLVATRDQLAHLRIRQENARQEASVSELLRQLETEEVRSFDQLMALERALYMASHRTPVHTRGQEGVANSEQLLRARKVVDQMLLQTIPNALVDTGSPEAALAPFLCLEGAARRSGDREEAAQVLAHAVKTSRALYQAMVSALEQSREESKHLQEAEAFLNSALVIATRSRHASLLEKQREYRLLLHDWEQYHGRRELKAGRISWANRHFLKAKRLALELMDKSRFWQDLADLGSCPASERNLATLAVIEQEMDASAQTDMADRKAERLARWALGQACVASVEAFLEEPPRPALLNTMTQLLDKADRLMRDPEDDVQEPLTSALRQHLVDTLLSQHLEDINKLMQSRDSAKVKQAAHLIITVRQLADRYGQEAVALQTQTLLEENKRLQGHLARTQELERNLASARQKIDFHISQRHHQAPLPAPPQEAPSRQAIAHEKQQEAFCESQLRTLADLLQKASEIGDPDLSGSILLLMGRLQLVRGTYPAAAQTRRSLMALPPCGSREQNLTLFTHGWEEEGKRRIRLAQGHLHEAINHIGDPRAAQFHLGETRTHLTALNQMSQHPGFPGPDAEFRQISRHADIVRTLLHLPLQISQGEIKGIEARLQELEAQIDQRLYPHLKPHITTLREEVRRRIRDRGFLGNLFGK